MYNELDEQLAYLNAWLRGPLDEELDLRVIEGSGLLDYKELEDGTVEPTIKTGFDNHYITFHDGIEILNRQDLTPKEEQSIAVYMDEHHTE